jgi:general secretion pathway protein I
MRLSIWTFLGRGTNRGFTLIEVLVAMVILTGGIMVLANSWSGNYMRIRNARINNTMAGLLERKMTEFEIKYKDKTGDEIEDDATGDFGAKFPGYRWEMKSQKFEMPDMTAALTSKQGGVDEMTLTILKTVTDFIKECVKELSVTVFYKGRIGKEIKASVATYFVDYTKELQVPGMGGGGAPGAGGAPGGAPGGGGTSPPSLGH